MDAATHAREESFVRGRPKPLDMTRRTVPSSGERTRNIHARQSPRYNHVSRAALPRPYQDRRSAERARPAAYPNYRLARRDLRRRRRAMTPSGTRGVLNDALSIYSLMRRSVTPLSPSGASAPGWKLPEASSRCGKMRRCEGRGETAQDPMSVRTPNGTQSGFRGGDRRVPRCGAGPAARAPTPTTGAAHS